MFSKILKISWRNNLKKKTVGKELLAAIKNQKISYTKATECKCCFEEKTEFEEWLHRAETMINAIKTTKELSEKKKKELMKGSIEDIEKRIDSSDLSDEEKKRLKREFEKLGKPYFTLETEVLEDGVDKEKISSDVKKVLSDVKEAVANVLVSGLSEEEREVALKEILDDAGVAIGETGLPDVEKEKLIDELGKILSGHLTLQTLERIGRLYSTLEIEVEPERRVERCVSECIAAGPSFEECEESCVKGWLREQETVSSCVNACKGLDLPDDYCESFCVQVCEEKCEKKCGVFLKSEGFSSYEDCARPCIDRCVIGEPETAEVGVQKGVTGAEMPGIRDISLVGRAFEFSREAPNEFGWLLASVLAIVFVFVFITVIVYRKKK